MPLKKFDALYETNLFICHDNFYRVKICGAAKTATQIGLWINCRLKLFAPRTKKTKDTFNLLAWNL